MNSIDVAYFLYTWRWLFRILFVLMIIIGLFKSNWKRKWLPAIPIALVIVVVADHMFYQPNKLLLVNAAANKVNSQRLVIGVALNGDAKAFPIRYLGFHHQVQDTVGGEPLIITCCTVCRTGRVFESIVKGKPE